MHTYTHTCTKTGRGLGFAVNLITAITLIHQSPVICQALCHVFCILHTHYGSLIKWNYKAKFTYEDSQAQRACDFFFSDFMCLVCDRAATRPLI